MNIKKYIIPSLLIFGLTACNQEEINTSVHGVTDQDLRVAGMEYATSQLNMLQQIFPIGSPALTTGPGNDLQATDLISSGSYIGYFGNNNNWNGTIEASWSFPDHRIEYIFTQLYTDVVGPWQDIYKLAKDSNEPQDKRVLAIANVMKVLGLLRATDTFGPIVYSEIGSGNLTPTPDAQEQVYKLMFADLDAAVAVLKDARQPILERSDIMYDGDVKSWLRLANSLMLRMAVRVHFKDEALAREYIAKATDPANGGLIESISQEAKIASSPKMPLRSPYIASVDEYGETRMGATIWSYLLGYGDPRVAAMFTEDETKNSTVDVAYLPLLPTSSSAKTAAAVKASKPRATEKPEVHLYRASETKFLLAEAALYGLYSGETAQSLYEEGVKLSFQEHGVGSADDYLANATALPKDYGNPYNRVYTNTRRYTENLSNNNVTVAWSDSDSQEKKLQRIMTQKYLALYPNAIEAWTEYRRTGYPYIMKPQDSAAPSRVGGDSNMRAPERFIYSATSKANNPNLNKVVELLGGEDTGATKLWWVRNNRPIQN